MIKLKQTSLYHLHQELGAKMVAFAGYEMPVQYGSGIIKEHLHCRKHVGFFDISHMGQCIITGQTAAQELEKLTPSNISELKTGQQRYTVLSNKNGGIIDDIIITRTKTGVMLIVNAACKEKDFAHLKQHLADCCELEVLHDQALFAIQGPATARIMANLSVPASKLSFMQSCATRIFDIPCFVSRCGYTGEDGFELSVDNQYAESLAKQLLAINEVKAIGLGARDTLRLEAGLSLYGNELSETVSPVVAGLKWILRKDASNFLGADTIQSQLIQGAAQKRVGIIIEGKIAARSHTELFDQQDRKIGLVTSGSFSPSLGKPIALGLIDSLYKEKVLYAKVRDRTLSATITQLPFIPHRFHRS